MYAKIIIKSFRGDEPDLLENLGKTENNKRKKVDFMCI